MAKKKAPLWIIWNIVLAVLFVVLGVLTCAFAGNKDFQNVILMIVGIALITIAGLQLLAQVLRIALAGTEETVSRDLSIAGVSASELAIGIVTIMVANDQASAEAVFKYLGYFLGIALLAIGGILIVYEIVFLVRKQHRVPVAVATIIGALIPIALGIVVIVFLNDKERFLTFFFVCVGILFVLVGVGLLCLQILKIRAARAIQKAAKEEAKKEVVEVQAEEVPAEEPKEESKEEPKAEGEDAPEAPVDEPEDK